ncbi:MAG: sigma-70 family RNA polymerase sigma factor [Candidatus Omnitrophica bacterium]|nr:sigma-70 family RNA polymerase sigma factor [Candidatus Omnitrophota bacterium]
MEIADSELVEKVKAGDKEAYVVLFNRYKDRIYGYLSRYLGDAELAQDVTLETFLSVYNNLPGYDEMSVFSSWIYRIATNYAKKALRRKISRKEVALEETLD